MANLLLAVIYLSFISLGLPDSLLGSGWPSMRVTFDAPVSYAGIISIIITAGTIVSALASERLTFRFGSGKVTVVSIVLTAIALLGFSLSANFIMMCLCAIPYGLGAGAIDAALNNYVALHYSSRHMSWLHAMWGIGTIISPSIMSFALTVQHNWRLGYRYVSIVQLVIAIIVMLSLPLWVQRTRCTVPSSQETHEVKPLGLMATLKLPLAKEVLLMFFAYCGIEGTAGLWASTFAMQSRGIDADQAALWASFFYLGITAGRIVSGFIAEKFTDTQLIRIGFIILAVGLIFILNPTSIDAITMIGLILIGVGCAPIYPSVIHSTPAIFGEENSQAVIGIQMASAYAGALIVAPLFGIIARASSALWLPLYLGVIFVVMVILHEYVQRKRTHE